MKTTSEKITTNTRVIKSHFTKYGDTFKAFKELINNSIQADAKNISIDITYSPSITCKSGIEKISITDDGHGVSKSNFKTTILEIGTNVKNNGQGIGRFSSFQIGELMKIDTVAYDEKESKFSRTVFGIDTTDLEDIALENIDLKVDYDFFENNNENSYYKVEIENLHHNIQHNPLKKIKSQTTFCQKILNKVYSKIIPMKFSIVK